MRNHKDFEILVVDDDKIVSLMHKHLLSNHLQPPISFFNGKKALDYLCSKNKPGKNFLLLLDINMPVLNGWDFLKELRKNSLACSIYVVLVTSSICTVDKRMAQEFEQVIGFCHKPLKVAHLEKLKELPQLKPLIIKKESGAFQS